MTVKSKLSLMVCAMIFAGVGAHANQGQNTSDSAMQENIGTERDPASVTDKRVKKSEKKSGDKAAKQESESSSAAASASAPTSQMDLKQGQHYHVIDFQQGQAQLTDTAKSNLRTMVENAKAQGEIDKLHVAVWSDKEFPKGESAELQDSDKKLADQRIDAIESYLEETLDVDDVETYSMAEKSNWFARAFNTEEAELKSLFSQRGAPSDVEIQEFRIVKDKGGPSKSVILLQMENERQSSGTTSGATSGTTSGSQSEMDRAPASTDDESGSMLDQDIQQSPESDTTTDGQ